MARVNREEVFGPNEIAVVHVVGRTVRNCYLLGNCSSTGKNYDHRKVWIEKILVRWAASFGIDLIAFSLMSTHVHLVLRTRPDVVETWDDTEVARRWLAVCPVRKNKDGSPKEPTQAEVNAICNDSERLAELRLRLSDISWWMQLMCQRVAQRANREDLMKGHFWYSRYSAVRLLDEASILACAAYVDLNPIRAAIAETIEDSRFTSACRRVQALVQDCKTALDAECGTPAEPGIHVVQRCAANGEVAELANIEATETATDRRHAPDGFLAPVTIGLRPVSLQSLSKSLLEEVHASVPAVVLATDSQREVSASSLRQIGSQELDSRSTEVSQVRADVDRGKSHGPLETCVYGQLGPMASTSGERCSDKGFAAMTPPEYLQLLDWTARQIIPGKRGSTPIEMPPIFQRLKISREVWCELVRDFGKYFSVVAGKPEIVANYRSRVSQQIFKVRRTALDLLEAV